MPYCAISPRVLEFSAFHSVSFSEPQWIRGTVDSVIATLLRPPNYNRLC
jgi:hypothetical protein